MNIRFTTTTTPTIYSKQLTGYVHFVFAVCCNTNSSQKNLLVASTEFLRSGRLILKFKRQSSLTPATKCEQENLFS